MLDPLGIELPTLNGLLKYASYHWEVLDGVRIDQASVSILKGKQNSTGLLALNFNQLLNNTFKIHQNLHYDIHSLTPYAVSPQSKIESEQANQPLEANKVKVQVRKSDLIQKIFRAFELDDKYGSKQLKNAQGYAQIAPYTYHAMAFAHLQHRKWKRHLNLNTRLLKFCQQFDELNERLLLLWVYDLLKQPKPPSHASIKKYLSLIGYEWLYFTLGQPLEHWQSEDFEELYEDILEYKMVERNNIAINQSANSATITRVWGGKVWHCTRCHRSITQFTMRSV